MSGHVVIVGGGIAGLAAAWTAQEAGRTVTVLEGSERWGGKIRTEPFAGVALDVGPDSFITRNPAALDLCRSLGLDADLVAPATGRAYLWARGALRTIPAGTLLGVPSRLGPVVRAGVLSPGGVARLAADLVLPRRPVRAGDTSVAALVGGRLGTEVVDRLVDPLVGGINAGRADELSVEVAAPQLAALGATGGSMIRAARRSLGHASGAGGEPTPVFLSLREGVGRLVDTLVARLTERGADVRLGTAATIVERSDAASAGRRWVVRAEGDSFAGDAVVVSVPSPAAATLIEELSPTAADRLRGIEYASVALVTLAYPRAAVAHRLDGSGFLTPRSEGRLLTAASWVGSKWPHLSRPDLAVVRVSAGRAGDRRALELGDDDLVARLHAELAEAIGINAPPREARVHRWADAFPQFRPGHLARVAEIEASLARDAPGVVVAGAAYRGVGIPTCIAGAQDAVRRALDAPIV